MAKPAIKTSDGSFRFFNTSSATVELHHADGVFIFPPFDVQGVDVPADIARPWLDSPVGQAYTDKNILKAKSGDDIGFDATSELEVPLDLKAMPAKGSAQAEVVKAPTLEGGAKLPIG